MSRPGLRVAIVGPAHPYKGGPANHVTTLAHQVAAAGHAASIESWSAQYPAMLYPGQLTIAEPEVPVFEPTHRELSWRRPDGWLRVGRRLGRDADVVVAFVYSSVQVPAYAGLVRGIRSASTSTRVIALCNNVLPHDERRIDRVLLTALYRRVDGLLVHSRQQRDLAAGLTPRPVAVAPLPPHLPATSPSPRQATAVRRTLLFFGVVRPYKGVDVLLRALALAPADIRLIVAGEIWGGAAALRALVEELGLGDRVDLRPGYVAAVDIPDLFGAVDALVLPYRSATASQNAAIAFEHGVPVIATTAGALADEVTDGVDGLTADPDDVPSLAAAVRRFYEPGVPERLRAGVRPVDAAPLWSAYVAALETLAV